MLTAERLAPTPAQTALDNPFTAQELALALGKMPARKAPGGDGLPAELLKRSDEAGACTLLALMNTVWPTGCVPASWCKGEVVSVYKTDDPLDCNNYRPLTMLPAFDKLFALLLVARLSDHVHLHDQQYAFRRTGGGGGGGAW